VSGRDEAVRVLDEALLALDALAEGTWARERIEAAVRGLEATLESKLRKFVTVLYVAIMGHPQGIPLFDSMAILGRERTLQRLRVARHLLE
jgi:glutamyl-tRNA synthetase